MMKLSSTEDQSVANVTDSSVQHPPRDMIDDADDSVPKAPTSPRQPTRRVVAFSPAVPSSPYPEEPIAPVTDGAATALNVAREELLRYQPLRNNGFQLWRQQDGYWRVSVIDDLERIERDLAYIMSVDARLLRHDLFTLYKDFKEFQRQYGLPTSREAWRELQHRPTTAPAQDYEYQKLEHIGLTTPTPKEHATQPSTQQFGKKTSPEKAAIYDSSFGKGVPHSYWGDHRGLLCYEYNEKGWKLVSGWPDLKTGSRFRKYEGLPDYDQYQNMLRIVYRNINGETKCETRPEPNWKDSEAVAQSMKLAQQSIRRFLGVGSREPRDRYLSQEIDFIAEYIRKDVGHDWQHTPENGKHVTKLIDAVNLKFGGKRLPLGNGRLSEPRPHRAKFGIINKVNRDPKILEARGKDVNLETTKKRKARDSKTQTGSKKKRKVKDANPIVHDESSSDASISIKIVHGAQDKQKRPVPKKQKMNNMADDAEEDSSETSMHSEFTDVEEYDEE